MLGHWRGLLLAALEILLERMVCIWKAFLDEELLACDHLPAARWPCCEKVESAEQLQSGSPPPPRASHRLSAGSTSSWEFSSVTARRATSLLHNQGLLGVVSLTGSTSCPSRRCARSCSSWRRDPGEPDRRWVSEKPGPDFSLFTLDRQNCCIWPHSVIRCLFFRFLSLTFERHDTTRSIRVAYVHSPPSPLMQLHDTHQVVSYGGWF